MNPFEPLTLLLSGLSGLAGALLTYLATRRGHEVSERSVYIGAVERVTGVLRAELDRALADRAALAAQVAALEARLARRDADGPGPPEPDPREARDAPVRTSR